MLTPASGQPEKSSSSRECQERRTNRGTENSVVDGVPIWRLQGSPGSVCFFFFKLRVRGIEGWAPGAEDCRQSWKQLLTRVGESWTENHAGVPGQLEGPVKDEDA